jgi:hypothetical protein
MPLGWNVQANGNEGLTGNKPDPSFSGALTASGLLAESYDFNLASLTDTLAVAGTVYASVIPLTTEQSVANLWYDVQAVGVTLTANQCWCGLINSAGLLIGQSAEQHTAWVSTGLGGSAAGGTPLVASSTGSLSNLPAGNYYGIFVYNGTTGPTFSALGLTSELTNINTTVAAANFNAASIATGVTTSASLVAAGLTTPFTLTSATLTIKRIWCGVS